MKIYLILYFITIPLAILALDEDKDSVKTKLEYLNLTFEDNLILIDYMAKTVDELHEIFKNSSSISKAYSFWAISEKDARRSLEILHINLYNYDLLLVKRDSFYELSTFSNFYYQIWNSINNKDENLLYEIEELDSLVVFEKTAINVNSFITKYKMGDRNKDLDSLSNKGNFLASLYTLDKKEEYILSNIDYGFRNNDVIHFLLSYLLYINIENKNYAYKKEKMNYQFGITLADYTKRYDNLYNVLEDIRFESINKYSAGILLSYDAYPLNLELTETINSISKDITINTDFFKSPGKDYVEVLKKATIQELLVLMNHYSRTVRAYVFMEIVNRDLGIASEIYQWNKDDNIIIYTCYGTIDTHEESFLIKNYYKELLRRKGYQV